MKILQNLKGAKALNKKEQTSINGGQGGTDCGTHFYFCDEAHPTNHNSFMACMTSCGCGGIE
jgi:hypothetical protein